MKNLYKNISKTLSAPRNIRLLALSTLILFTLITIMASFQILGVKTQYSLKQFFPSYHPLLRQDEEVKSRFKLVENSPFLLVATVKSAKEDWSNPKYLEAVRALTEQLKNLPHVKDVKNISTLQGAIQTQDELGIGSIIDYLTPSAFKKEIHHNPILSPLFVSEDAKTLTIFVDIDDLSAKETEDLKKELVDVSTKTLDFANINIGGFPAVQSDINHILNREIVQFIFIAFFMSLFALALIFRNLAPIAICTIVALSTNILSVWGISIFGFSFSILSSTIPILVTMTVISISIHSILRLIERIPQTKQSSRYDLVVLKTFKELFRPNLLTALTTSVGFFTLTFSDSPIIKEFGLSVGIALLVTWINTVFLLPAFLLTTPKPVMRQWMSAKARWPLYILKFPKIILFAIVALSIFGAWKGQHLSWNARLYDDLPESHNVRRTSEFIDQTLGGLIPLDIEVRISGKETPWSNEYTIGQLDRLAKKIRDKAGVGSVLTLADILRASGLKTGATKASAAEIMFLLSMSADNPVNQFLSSDGESTRLSIRLRDIQGYRMWNLVQDIRKLVIDKFPEARIKLAGTAAYVHDINNALSKELLFGFWQAMLVIFILLIIAYRSVSWAVLACLPNLTPPAMLLGTLSLLQIPIKPGIAIILSISLGLAFNNTVYLLERMRHHIDKGRSYQKSLFHTFWSEANPCFFSSMVLIVGFASFAVSYFKMNQLFGVFMVLSVLTGLLGDLVLLPALLQFLVEQGKRFIKISIIILFSLLAPKAHAIGAQVDSDIQKLGETMRANIETRDESGIIGMKIIESDGTSKTREISFSRLTDKGAHYTIMRMISPKDIKGTALLSVIKNEQEEKWIYLPSSKQTRKIATSDQNARILDSELYTEDFDLNIIKDATSHIQKSDANKTIVETKIESPKSPYSKSISWVSKEGLLQKAELYDKKGKLLKVLQFTKYEKVSANKWRSMKIDIENMQNKRKTELTLSNIKTEQNLKESNFTIQSLAD